MNGIELARGYYEEFGKPMLEQEFPELLPFIATGFVGSGSERFGFDDAISRDHDFEPGFCIFLPGEDVVDRKTAFRLERAYAKLPREYMGFTRSMISPVGGSRNGVIRTAEFFQRAVGQPDGNLTVQQWLEIPDYALAEAVNGEVFEDAYGEFSAIRERLMDMPEDIMLKRLAGNLLIMAQAGQYNFSRCLKHGEPEAAQLACGEFVNSAMKATFLLQGHYMPYYKWSFRALKSLLFTEELAKRLSFILMADHTDSQVAEQKYTFIEEIASYMIEDLQDRGITKAICGDLEKHAYSVNDFITDSEIRNLNILASI
ncbi:MAG: DUF4037 domain-containing protein [Lachnospiraceae bacterium]|nr:DUF4037 domain-containing protein [Lachnospiraceae bacterium]